MLVIEPFIITIPHQSSKFYKRFHNKLYIHSNLKSYRIKSNLSSTDLPIQLVN